MFYIAIIFLPLLAALISGLFGRKIGDKSAYSVTSTFLALSAFLSWIALAKVGFGGNMVKVELVDWVKSGTLSASWVLRIDTLTAVMLVIVSSISALVHVFSIGYMKNDPHQPRFYCYLSLLTFAMLMLVTSDNLLQMLFGWEAVTLASYLLIGFWYKKPSANAAAIKTFIVNRVGDFGFVLGIIGCYLVFGSLDFDTIFANATTHADMTTTLFGFEVDILTVLCLLLFVGAMGKSAQFLLHSWLYEAVESPTPAAALIYSATLVTAGVFLVARCSPLFELAPFALSFIALTGSITAIFAASLAIVENDIKRVLALSTGVQLGCMFTALGFGAYGVAIFHLFTHAFINGLLFLGCGSIIHALSHERDMRKMGGLYKHIPRNYVVMLIGITALTAFPLTAGYFSKIAIFEATYAAGSSLSIFSYVLLVAVAALTAWYGWRLIFLTFHGKPRASADVMGKIDEPPLIMMLPLYLLSVVAIFAGMFFYGYFVGQQQDSFWGSALFTGDNNNILSDMKNTPGWVSWVPSIFMLLGFMISFICYVHRPGLPNRFVKKYGAFYEFMLQKGHFDKLYEDILMRPIQRLGSFFWKKGDEELMSRLKFDDLSRGILDVASRIEKLQAGHTSHYVFAMIIGVAIILTYLMFVGV